MINVRNKIKFVSVVLISIVLAFTPVIAYGAESAAGTVAETTTETTNALIDVNEITAAIEKRNYIPIYREFVEHYGDVYRKYFQDPRFPLFNAEEYMKNNPDVAAACGNDPRKALEHYLTIGIFEARRSYDDYDMGKFLREYPEVILSADFLNNISTPQKFFLAVQDKIIDSNTPDVNLGSDGPSVNYEKTFTLIYYIAASNLDSPNTEITNEIIQAMLGAYGSSNMNILMALGGTSAWSNDFLISELPNIGDANNAALYKIDVEKVNDVIGPLVSEYGSIDKVYENVENGGDAKTKILSSLLGTNSSGLVRIEYLNTNAQKAVLSQQSTISEVLKVATTDYKADNYALIFGGHGGGSLGGSCESDDDKSQVLTPQTIAAALKNAGFGSSIEPLVYLGFDSCMMGGMEVAYTLKDYYQYMFGAETFMHKDVGYYKLEQCIDAYKSTDNIAAAIAYQVFENRYAQGAETGILETSAIFNSEYAQAAIDSMDNWAKVLDSSMNKGSLDGNNKYIYSQDEIDVYKAMKKALLTSYQMTGYKNGRDSGYNYFDAKDYLTKFEAALDTTYKDAHPEVVTAIKNCIECIDNFVEVNLYAFDNKAIYKHINGSNPEIENKAFMEAYLNYYFCGANFMIPDYCLTSFTNYFDNNVVMKERGENLDLIREKYCDKYNSELGNYSNLVLAYANYMMSDDEVTRVRNLVQEMTTSTRLSDGESIIGYDQLTSVSIDSTNGVLKVNVGEYDSIASASEFTSGDAFIDLIDTTQAFKVYLTRKILLQSSYVENKGKDTETTKTTDYEIDVIIGENTVDYTALNGDDGRIDILTAVLQKSNYNYVSTYENEQTHYYKLEAMIPLDLTRYGDDKTLIISELGLAGDASNYEVYLGEYYENGSDTSVGQCRHLFSKNDDGTYSYKGSVIRQVDQQGTISYKDANADSEITDDKISFSHYTVMKANNGTDYIASIENDPLGFFDDNTNYLKCYDGSTEIAYSWKYNISDNIKMNVSTINNLDNESLHNGYYVVTTTISGSNVCLNNSGFVEIETANKNTYSAIYKSANVNGYYASVILDDNEVASTEKPNTQSSQATSASKSTVSEESAAENEAQAQITETSTEVATESESQSEAAKEEVVESEITPQAEAETTVIEVPTQATETSTETISESELPEAA